MNVVLIGFRCAGKSTVGKALADRLRRPFVDCDEYIEAKTHLTIREIFDLAGESYFRSLEGQAIVDLAKLDGRVIATGGGAVLRRQNTKTLKRNGIVVLLEVTPEVALERIRRDGTTKTRRPPLAPADDQMTEINHQIELRRPYYQGAADIVVQTDERPVPDVVKEVMLKLKEKGFGGSGGDHPDHEEVPK